MPNNLGQLTEITSPWNVKIGYTYNHAGELTGVTGQGYAGVTSYASGMVYRAFGGLKQMNYANGRNLSSQYDNRLRLTSWSIPGVLRMQYAYEGANGSRLEFARNLDDETLDRYFGYDHVGRLWISRSGNEARLAIGEQVPLLYNGPYSHVYQYDYWGNMTYREGWGGANPSFTATYTNNKRSGFAYDAAGNLTNDLSQTLTYDATGQQATASYSGYSLQQIYDGDRLRVKKVENGTTTYFLRSTVLGGQIVAELNSAGAFTRGFVYLGGQLLAVQQSNQVSWVHQDPLVKSKRVTNNAGSVVSTVELDPWGGDTNRSSNEAFQPRRFTTYDRDGNSSDEAMHRRYNRWHSRFDQPDPYGGSYDLTNPQSFNRYSYVINDPVNLVDPSGLCPDGTVEQLDARGDPQCVGVGVESVTINIGGGGQRTGGVGGASSGAIEIETGGNGPTEAEIIPQDPLEAPDTQKDCAILQNTAAVFASRGEGMIGTIRDLRNRFVEGWGEPPTEEFGSSGFKEDYRDKGSSPNQVRHYVGILSTAFKASVTANLALVTPEAAYIAALSAANLRERGGTQGDRADRSLNAVAVGHAVRLAYGVLAIDDLARAIMEDVCDPNIFK